MKKAARTTKIKGNGKSKKVRSVILKLRKSKRPYIFITAFALIGTVLLLATRAATSTANFEAEVSTLSSNAKAINDSTASAGQAVKFGSGPTAFECSGVKVTTAVGELHDFIQSHPNGTIFCFEPGVYNLTKRAIPRTDQKLIAKPGAIIDGSNIPISTTLNTNDCIIGFSGSQVRVTFQGFEVRNCPKDGIETGTDWKVMDNEVHSNNIGIRLKMGSQALRNHVHHNGQLGMVVNGPSDTVGNPIIIEDNEISYNNTLASNPGDEGATKFFKANGLEVRGNWVHHNTGNGLWTDGDNIDVIYEDNLVEYNTKIGIFHEISYDAVIRNNTVQFNTPGIGESVWHGAQIHLQTSKNTEVYGNTIKGVANGIGIVDSNRIGGIYGPWETKNNSVYNNDIQMGVGATTGAVGPEDRVITTEYNNKFWGSTYRVPGSGDFWRWAKSGADVNLNWSEWQATGNDTDGTRIIE